MSPESKGPSNAVSIIVPTYREAANIEPLTTRIFAAIGEAGIEAELIVVDDDSTDGTEACVDRLAAQYPIRLIVRRGERGLSGAVLAGFQHAAHDRLVVLDADLQHPPEMIPAMLERLGRADCDFVIGSRYVRGGSIRGDWPWFRKIGSRVATLLASPLVPVSDPLSGFFAMRRNTWETAAAALDPIGYKIALELFVKGRCRHPVEVPIDFATRTAGESKLGAGVFVQYLRHLAKLYRFRFPWLVWTLATIVCIIAIALAWRLLG